MQEISSGKWKEYNWTKDQTIMIDTEGYRYTKIKQTYNKDSTKVVLPRWDCLRVSQDISYCRACKIAGAHHGVSYRKNI